jgi:hypothetical protein
MSNDKNENATAEQAKPQAKQAESITQSMALVLATIARIGELHKAGKIAKADIHSAEKFKAVLLGRMLALGFTPEQAGMIAPLSVNVSGYRQRLDVACGIIDKKSSRGDKLAATLE